MDLSQPFPSSHPKQMPLQWTLMTNKKTEYCVTQEGFHLNLEVLHRFCESVEIPDDELTIQT